MNDLNTCALRLLKFVEDSIHESLGDAASLQGLLAEADCAIRVLQRTLKREDHTKLALLMLMGTFEVNFEKIAADNQPDPSKKLEEALKIVLNCRMAFTQPSAAT
jgi:hypothetical protein